MPIPLDLFKPYLSQPEANGKSAQNRSGGGEKREDKDVKDVKDVVADASSVTPNGDANP